MYNIHNRRTNLQAYPYLWTQSNNSNLSETPCCSKSRKSEICAPVTCPPFTASATSRIVIVPNQAMPGHSSWQLTRKDENQKTIRHSIPKRSLEETRKQVEEYSRFQALVKRFAEINDQLCQARVRAGQIEKKNAVNRDLARRLRRRARARSGRGCSLAVAVASGC